MLKYLNFLLILPAFIWSFFTTDNTNGTTDDVIVKQEYKLIEKKLAYHALSNDVPSSIPTDPLKDPNGKY